MRKNNIVKVLGKLVHLQINGSNVTSSYYQKISGIMHKLHFQIPTLQYNKYRTPCKTQYREEFYQGANYKRAVIYLLSGGCAWALSDGNGCTMCGHLAKQTRKNDLTPINFIEQFKNEFTKIDFKNSPLLNIYNNGSFINDSELPAIARDEILKLVENDKHIKMLVIETRPEFVKTEIIKEIQKIIYSKYVEVAIGLEIKSDLYRSIAINKGFDLHQYNHAAQIISNYLNLRTYVLLKPLLLNEEEGIVNAIETIRHAFNMGSKTVSLEACTVQNYTLIKLFYDKGFYRSPWLWSIIEVVKATHHLGKLIVGLFQFFPSPNIVPYNCPICSIKIYEAIKEYNRTLDVKKFDGLSCSCKDIWREELKQENISFSKKIFEMANILDQT